MKKVDIKPKPEGRPTKYKPEFCEEIVEFFDSEPYEDVNIPHYGKTGEISWTDTKRMPNKLPTLREFAKHIEVGVSTVYDWIDEKHASYHSEFSDAFTRAKDLQKWFLVQNGLQGLYNPAFAIFTAKNITDMRDKQETEISGNITLNFHPALLNINNDGNTTSLHPTPKPDQSTSKQS